MRGPKVVLIGAGSAFFGLQTIHGMVTKETLRSGALALVDTDVKKLGWVADAAKRAIAASKVPLKLTAKTDRRKALKGADFVILAFAAEGVKLRGLDAEISIKHGMPLCSADTVGPGGIMRTLREVPRQAAILKDVERLCPDAWVVNWVNPTAAMGIAMRRFPRLRSFALCDLPHNPMFDDNLIVSSGLAPSADAVTDELRARVRIRSGGVNHFNWLVAMEHNGSDVTEAVKAAVRRDAEAADMDTGAPSVLARWRLTEAIGYVPMCIRHTKEYLPFFQGHDTQWRADGSGGADALRLDTWDPGRRMRWMRERWADMRNLASGRRAIEGFLDRVLPDHAIDIIEAMWTGSSKQHFYINIRNGGAVTNMSDDAYLELPCAVDMNEIRPLPFGPIPRPLLGYMHRVLDEHELAVDAAVSCDKTKLRQAFLASMLAVSIPDVDACIKQMLRRQRRHLPASWY